jgi:hypothetical protein
MNSAKCRIEFLHHFGERQFECGPPSDQHIIVAAAHTFRRREPYELP